MKNILLFLTGCILPLFLIGQNDDKRDYVWVLGGPIGFNFGGTYMDFNTRPPDTTFFDIQRGIGAFSTVCDEDGQLACYSNNCEIVNKYEEVVANGDGLNLNPNFDLGCMNWGYPEVQSTILLPFPGHPDQYYAFYMNKEFVTGHGTIPVELLYANIDMAAENGHGRVIEKNIPIISSQRLQGYVTATRHGNGRDWWIVTTNHNGSVFYKFLLTPLGVEGPFVQTVFNTSAPRFGGGSQISFSPDGNWYADGLADSTLRIARFDRCTGTFYEPQTFHIPVPANYGASGVAFSRSSRFLYFSATFKIHQLDLWASDIEESQQVVAEYDGFTYGVSTDLEYLFFQAMLTPDDKIYLTVPNGMWYLHVIEHPDSLGMACQVNQHSYILPVAHSFSVPNFPFYRLYDAAGSPCDTLGINGPVNSTTTPEPSVSHNLLEVVPNPTTGVLRFPDLERLAGPFSMAVFDTWGSLRDQRTIPDSGFDMTAYPAGAYVLVVTDPSGRIWRAKVVKI
jgi:hypothetical protein